MGALLAVLVGLMCFMFGLRHGVSVLGQRVGVLLSERVRTRYVVLIALGLGVLLVRCVAVAV